jgi:putative sigma-54 modulation protein
MQVTISGHHIDVTSALHDFVTSKLERLERHFDHISKINVTLSVEKQRQMADASIHIAGADVVANAAHEDMYAAIDLLTDKLDRQLIKHKEKNLARQKGSAPR